MSREPKKERAEAEGTSHSLADSRLADESLLRSKGSTFGGTGYDTDTGSELDATIAGDATGAPKRVEPTPALPTGTRINGRYRVEGVLGEGGMGLVYHVTDELHPERHLALKTLRREQLRSDRLSLLKAEFKVMAQLRHPGLASVYDFEQWHETEDYFFTMDRVVGTDIKAATEDSPLDTVVDYLVQICRALSYVHSRQLTHFDIKPQNILVTSESQVKMLDFGLAGARPGGGGRQLFGTPLYMAPEVVKADVAPDYRADLYSLGITAYELLCRRLPFTAPVLAVLLKRHATEPISFRKEDEQKIPEWLCAIVEKLSAKDPADRFRSANAVIEAINAQGGYHFPLETQETTEGYLLSSRFVGRQEELSRVGDFVQLRTNIRSTTSSPMLAIGGESGIGKSRLMREIRHQAQLNNLPFIVGNCYENAADEHGPVAEAIVHFVRMAEAFGGVALLEEYGADLGKLDPQLAKQWKVDWERHQEDPEAERVRLLERLSEFLVRVAASSPYVLYFNDLQWARPATIDFISYLLTRIQQQEADGHMAPIAVLGTFRSDEVEGRPLEGFLKRQGTAVERLELQRLDKQQIQQLLTSMLGVETIPEQFAKRVTQETAGNPFFVEEIMRSLFENGSVYVSGGAWAARSDIGALMLPTKISEAFLRRVAQLDEPARAVLEVLAVCGRPTALPVLQQASQRDEETVHAALRELQRRQMVQLLAVDVVQYQVSHDRMRESIYDALVPEQRKNLHLRIATAIETEFGDNLQEYLQSLALHYRLAGSTQKAVHYNFTAGIQAKNAYANEVALEMLEYVLQALPSHKKTNEILEHLADLQVRRGAFEAAKVRYEQALQGLHDSIERARIYRKLGRMALDEGYTDGAADNLWKAVRLLGGAAYARRGGAAGQIFFLTTKLKHMTRSLVGKGRGATGKEEERRRKELSQVYTDLTAVAGFT